MKLSFSSEAKSSKLDHRDDEANEENEGNNEDNDIEELKNEIRYSKQLKLRLPSHLNKEINENRKLNLSLLKSVQSNEQLNNKIEESTKKKFKFIMKPTPSSFKNTSKQLINPVIANASNQNLSIIKDTEPKFSIPARTNQSGQGKSKLNRSSSKSKVKFDSSAKLNLKKSIITSSISKTNIGKVLKNTLFKTDRSSKDVLSISAQSSSALLAHSREKSEINKRKIKDILSSYTSSIAILKSLEQYQDKCLNFQGTVTGKAYKSKRDKIQEDLKKGFDSKAISLLTEEHNSEYSNLGHNGQTEFPIRLNKILKDPVYTSFSEIPTQRLFGSQRFFTTLENLYGAAVGSKFKKKIYTLCLKDLVRKKNMNFLTERADPLKSYLKMQKDLDSSRYRLRFFTEF